MFNATLPPYALIEVSFIYTLAEGNLIEASVADTTSSVNVLGYPALDNSTTAGALGTLELIPDGLYYITVTDPTPQYKVKISEKQRADLIELKANLTLIGQLQ